MFVCVRVGVRAYGIKCPRVGVSEAQVNKYFACFVQGISLLRYKFRDFITSKDFFTLSPI